LSKQQISPHAHGAPLHGTSGGGPPLAPLLLALLELLLAPEGLQKR
jgi:hypothetical protein